MASEQSSSNQAPSLRPSRSSMISRSPSEWSDNISKKSSNIPWARRIWGWGGGNGSGGGIDDDDDDDSHDSGFFFKNNNSTTVAETIRSINTTTTTTTPWTTTTAAAATARLGFQSLLGVTIVLYVLNQKHWLPLPLSRVVSQALFWPSLPITVARRLWLGDAWCTEIDDLLVMGGAPFGIAGFPEKLYHKYNIRGVVNFCEEYKGPIRQYKKLGITQLHLPTPDHFEPSVEALEETVRFIQQFRQQQQEAGVGGGGGGRVYVHCRAGHGRSAAAVLAWMLAKHDDDPSHVSCQMLNQELYQLRKVRKTLWKQDNIRQFHERLMQRHASFDDISLTKLNNYNESENNKPKGGEKAL
ncbi:hypothetical protein ACA910_021519 [Epithemia clementina (nom. ined.)]